MATTSNNKVLINRKVTQDRTIMRILFIVTTVAVNFTPETAVPSTPTTAVINTNSTSTTAANSTSRTAVNSKSTIAANYTSTVALNFKSATAANFTSIHAVDVNSMPTEATKFASTTNVSSVLEQRPNESRMINDRDGKDIPLEVYIVVACIIGTALLVVLMGRPKSTSVGPSNAPTNSNHLFQFYHQPDIEGLHDPRVVRAN